ncbi:TPA: DUF4422 domain-containing protein [Candidatus Scatousia excrementigallinarum]|uniref:DUF4422 domain-containing protein n=1 Tax=Candidatus Scatousia excrementigallinarum TaxID=2840935 RepID=A0A9D1JNB8_9BACT|nr:DUF4422 domain-containing protein [Candidatus Scatousia excrementigallinarum]
MSILKYIKNCCDILKINNKNVNLFMVYHKPTTLYSSKIVTPVHAGREVAFTGSKDGTLTVEDYKWLEKNMIGDNIGDNISVKNRFYNEITVTYWIWKNCKSSIVGLMHYRRIFDFRAFGKSKDYTDVMKKYCVDEKTVKKLLSEYDLILPDKLNFGEQTLYQQYEKHHYISDLNIAIDVIKEKYPQMSKYADMLKEQHSGYFFNMLIARKNLFDKYAEFLFDILFETEKRLPPRSSRHIYQQRIEAFLAERISNVYFNYLIYEKGLKVKDVPVMHLEPENPVKRLTFKNSKKPKSLTIYIKLRY